MECCICYTKPLPNLCFYITNCNHIYCFDCFKKIDQKFCPYCRQELKNIPVELRKNKIDEESNKILLKIKNISEYHYSYILDSISKGKHYDRDNLMEFYQDLYREYKNINNIKKYFQ
tara:strand:- start:650 stop:1000 length:351 start_codon:yes stop_codon:yes gene_type:complete